MLSRFTGADLKTSKAISTTYQQRQTIPIKTEIIIIRPRLYFLRNNWPHPGKRSALNNAAFIARLIFIFLLI